MPSVSKKQHNLMALVANDPKAAKRLGIPQSVGRDFMKADKGRKFGSGGSMKESKAMMRREVAFMKKKGAPKSMIRHEEAEMRGMKKGVRKFDKGGPTRGGPTTRVPTGPTAPRYGYIPNPFGPDIRYKLGPSGVSFPKKATTNPRDIFGNENPNFNQALREAEEAAKREAAAKKAAAKPAPAPSRGGGGGGAPPMALGGMGPIMTMMPMMPEKRGKVTVEELPEKDQGKYRGGKIHSVKKMRVGGQSAPQRGGIGSMISGGVGANQPRKMRGGGMAYSGGGSVFRKSADGIASKGKTKGHMVKMRYGGKC